MTLEPIDVADRLAAVRRLARPPVAVLLVGVAVAACSGGAGLAGSASPLSSSAPPPASASPFAPGPASAGPASPAPASDGIGGSGAVGGDPGSSASPAPVAPVGPGQSSGALPGPSPTEVQPVAGLLSVHDVRATTVQASVSSGHLVARVTWWSGPPPCSELSEVSVARSGGSFALTVREGAAQLGVACPALAMAKATTVDLGPVTPGTYRVSALGVDAPAEVLYAG